MAIELSREDREDLKKICKVVGGVKKVSEQIDNCSYMNLSASLKGNYRTVRVKDIVTAAEKLDFKGELKTLEVNFNKFKRME